MATMGKDQWERYGNAQREHTVNGGTVKGPSARDRLDGLLVNDKLKNTLKGDASTWTV
jgi:hypothetical protein